MLSMDLNEARKILRNALAPRTSELVTVADAALMLGIAQETIRRRIRRGEIPAWGKPGTLRVRLVDLMPPYDPRSRTE
jgi:excisionase family DNA binding protein